MRRQLPHLNAVLFFFSTPAAAEIYTLSLHDALPILLTWLESRKQRKLLETLVKAVPFLTPRLDRKSTRLNSSHRTISYAVFCLKKKSAIPFLRATGLSLRYALISVPAHHYIHVGELD